MTIQVEPPEQEKERVVRTESDSAPALQALLKTAP